MSIALKILNEIKNTTHIVRGKKKDPTTSIE